MLKKVASGVLALLPCSRTGSTLRAPKGLWPCWTDFFEHSHLLNIFRLKIVDFQFSLACTLALPCNESYHDQNFFASLIIA